MVVHRYVLVLCIRNRLYRSRFKVIISGGVDYNDYLWIIKYDNNARMGHPYDGGIIMCPDPLNILLDIMAVTITMVLFTISWIASAGFIVFCILCYFFASRHYVMCGIPGRGESRYSEWKHRNDPNRQNEDNDRVHQIFNELKEKGLIRENTRLKSMYGKEQPPSSQENDE